MFDWGPIIVRTKALSPEAKEITRATEGAAGFDLRVPRDTYVGPGETSLIPIGWAFEIPQGFMGLIKARSSIFSRGFVVDGVIDSDYRGEVRIMIRNLSNRGCWFEAGERVAQVVFVEVPDAHLMQVPELSDTVRGDGGLGSTGRK